MINNEVLKRRARGIHSAIILSRLPEVHRVVLFGRSGKQGGADKDSDVDLLLTHETGVFRNLDVLSDARNMLNIGRVPLGNRGMQVHLGVVTEQDFQHPKKSDYTDTALDMIINARSNGITLFRR